MTMDRVALIRVDDIARMYDFGATHPLRPERVLLTYDNIERVGLARRDQVTSLASTPAPDDEILAVHASDFVDAVKQVDAGEMERGPALEFGLGTGDNPIFPNMHGASAAVCGASVMAAEAVASGEFLHAFNPAGGLHHARRREASGFCIYNDPAVAIARVLELRPDWRVMYVDVDVHHGDGVQWIFYDDPRVLTVSLHQSGRYLYPGTGFEDEIGEGAGIGTSANIPLLPYTGNEDYLWVTERLLSQLAEAFRPHLMLTQLGADSHHGDPLAELGLTMPAFPRLAEILHDTAHRYCDGRWVATGGGGYQAETVVPKVWTMHFAEMCGDPGAVPHDWLDDRHPADVARPYRESIERSLDQVTEACVPHLTALVA